MIGWIIDSIFAGIIGFIVSGFIGWMISNRKYLRIKFNTLYHMNEDYRISFAYLFRIKVNNKYLLIKGNRINQYQPVGGVYKYFSSFNEIKNELDILDEKDSDFYESNDLRIFVKGKNVIKILKWIEAGKNRECDHLRELYEELLLPGYVDFNVLENIKLEFLKRYNSGVHYSNHFKCKEILIFDVIDLSGIESEIEKIINSDRNVNRNLVLVDVEDIERECFMMDGLSTKIGAHCKIIK